MRKRSNNTGPWRILRVARLFRFVSALVLVLLSFETAGVELVASHTVDATHPVEVSDGGGCADHDDAGACDCGPNCHCCFTCAHHVTPALASHPLASPLARLGIRALEAPTPIAAHVSSTDVAPPPKVPKLLA